MTEAAAPGRQADPADFLQLWSDSFSRVLGQITGSAIACKITPEAPADFSAAAESDLLALAACSGGLRGEMSLRLASPVALRLAQVFTSEPATPGAEVTADHREAVIELLRQVAGIVSTGAKARWGEVQIRLDPAPAAPSWASAGSSWLQAGDEGANGMALEFSMSAALVAELKTEKAEAAKPAAKAETAKPAAAADTGTLDLLMDVELAVTLRFGSRRLLLREVLDLNPGSVVELDRKIQEPVDLLLDGKMVARGEVVVIEGNYGLRVTDISTLESR
ncbi:MAG: flagellar motor switch protein FliN [Candidatus Sulfotelmatobacter sp.]